MAKAISLEPGLEFQLRSKQFGVALAMLLLLGYTGAHRFYLARTSSGLLYVGVLGAGLLALANQMFAPAWVAIMLVGFWMLLDLALLPKMVRSYNEQLAENITKRSQNIKVYSPPPGVGEQIIAMLMSLTQSRVGFIGFTICVFWVAVALLAPLLAPYDPQQLIEPLASPGTKTAEGMVYLGTDFLGRDILSRIIHGSRTVIIWAPLATASAYTLGVMFGLLGGYLGGWFDDAISFVANLILAFPVLVLLILIIGILGEPSGLSIVLAVTFASAPGVFRIVRGEVLVLRNLDFIAAAKSRGENMLYIMFSEILPNARGPLIVDACLRMGYTTITIGILGFLGLGFPPPTPDWGGMINENRQMALTFPHMTVFPSLALVSLILGLNLLADGVREITRRP